MNQITINENKFQFGHIINNRLWMIIYYDSDLKFPTKLHIYYYAMRHTYIWFTYVPQCILLMKYCNIVMFVIGTRMLSKPKITTIIIWIMPFWIRYIIRYTFGAKFCDPCKLIRLIGQGKRVPPISYL